MLKEEIPKKLTYRYMTALFILVVILTTTQVLIHSHTLSQETDSRVINLSGRQRMLSQRIVKNALFMGEATTQEEYDKARDELIISLDLWQRTHEGLINGNSELGLPGNNNNDIITMFNAIEPYFVNVAFGAKIILEKNFSDIGSLSWNQSLKVIEENEAQFLEIMDQIVFKYDELAKEKVSNNLNLEKTLYILSLVAIAFEIMYIFRPAVKQIDESIKEVVQNEKNMQKLFDVTPNPLFLVDNTNLIINKVNTSAVNLSGLSEDDLINHDLTVFIPHDYIKMLHESTEYLDVETSVKEVIFNDSIGNSYNMILTANTLSLDHKIFYLINLTDISSRVNSENKLKELVAFDEMTGLLNRRTGLMMLKKELLKAERDLYPLSFCFIDLDGLKKINDLYGHTDGDWVIKESAHCILGAIREQDIAFRYGGDEYCIIFPNCTLEQAKSVLERVENEFENKNAASGKPYEMGLSFGIIFVDKSTDYQIENVIELADKEMYIMKNNKKQITR